MNGNWGSGFPAAARYSSDPDEARSQQHYGRGFGCGGLLKLKLKFWVDGVLVVLWKSGVLAAVGLELTVKVAGRVAE